MENRNPMERLTSAYRVEVDENTKTRHLAEMGAALKSAPPAPVPTGFTVRRKLAGALTAVFVVAAPVGMAVAAEDAVPGDILYPMKQAQLAALGGIGPRTLGEWLQKGRSGTAAVCFLR